MTVRVLVHPTDLTNLTINVDNKIDPENGVRYLGKAWRDAATGRWLCLADVGALCVVEVRLIVSSKGAPSTSDPERTTPLYVVEAAD